MQKKASLTVLKLAVAAIAIAFREAGERAVLNASFTLPMRCTGDRRSCRRLVHDQRSTACSVRRLSAPAEKAVPS